MSKNEMGKTRPVNQPYEIYLQDGWEWRVLKHYQSKENEAKNVWARCMCAVKGPGTFGGYNMGDTYIKDYTSYGNLMPSTKMAEHLKENPW
jgi:hypothetical protein